MTTKIIPVSIDFYSKIDRPTCAFNINKTTISITRQITDNPLLSSIGYTCNLLDYIEQEDRIHVLKECYELYKLTPNLILMDVENELRKCYPTEIEKTFNVIYKQLYTSTNNSNMCMYIVTLEPPKS